MFGVSPFTSSSSTVVLLLSDDSWRSETDGQLQFKRRNAHTGVVGGRISVLMCLCVKTLQPICSFLLNVFDPWPETYFLSFHPNEELPLLHSQCARVCASVRVHFEK